MATEIQHKQNVRFGKDFYTDATTDQAIQDLDARKGDGVSGDEMDQLLSSGADSTQITEREYSAMNRWVQQNFNQLSPEAKAKWAKFDEAMQGAGGKGTAEKHHKADEVVIMNGPALTTLMKEIGETGKAASPPSSDGVDGAGGADASADAPTTSTPPHSDPPAPPSEPPVSGGSGAIGNTWGEILSALLSKLSDREDLLKKKGKTLGGANKTEKDQTASEQAELTQFQMDLQELQRLFQMVSQIAQSVHDTAKQTIGNIRA